MALRLGDEFPNFEAQTTIGRIKFHEWIGESWAMLFAHPADYTPVCTTESSRVRQLIPEFQKRNVKVIDLSCDDVGDHEGWAKDIQAYAGFDPEERLPYPIIADEGRDLAVKLGMLDPDAKNASGQPLTCRAVFIIGPDKKVKLFTMYPSSTGRNFDELMRVIDSLQLTAAKRVATPADWQPGQPAMLIPQLTEEEAKQEFPGFEKSQVPSGKEYMRFTSAY